MKSKLNARKVEIILTASILIVAIIQVIFYIANFPGADNFSSQESLSGTYKYYSGGKSVSSEYINNKRIYCEISYAGPTGVCGFSINNGTLVAKTIYYNNLIHSGYVLVEASKDGNIFYSKKIEDIVKGYFENSIYDFIWIHFLILAAYFSVKINNGGKKWV